MKSLSQMYDESQRSKQRMKAIVWFTLIYFLLAVLITLTGTEVEAQDRAAIERVVVEESLEQGIDPELVLALIFVESGFNPNAVGSSHGEIGLMQLHPRYFPLASFDVEDNVRRGVRYLAEIKRRKQHEGCGWFVYYNVGINRSLNQPTMHSYYKKVLNQYPNYCERFQLAGME